MFFPIIVGVIKSDANYLQFKNIRGAWVAQLVEHLTLAQVLISRFVSLSPMSGSVLRAQSLEPALDSVCVSVSLPLPCSCSCSVFFNSQKQIKTLKNEKIKY